jgi:hypothetical protein
LEKVRGNLAEGFTSPNKASAIAFPVKQKKKIKTLKKK